MGIKTPNQGHNGKILLENNWKRGDSGGSKRLGDGAIGEVTEFYGVTRSVIRAYDVSKRFEDSSGGFPKLSRRFLIWTPMIPPLRHVGDVQTTAGGDSEDGRKAVASGASVPTRFGAYTPDARITVIFLSAVAS